MKKIALTSLLIVLSLPTFAADFSAATTEAEAYAIYKTAAEKIIAAAKQGGATKSELKDLQAIVDAVISEYTNVDAKTIKTKELTEEEKEARIEAAQEKYDAAKEAEQSAENKLLGATTMMATGMGAMELASSISDQQADQEAEDQMRAYLSTFQCQYGSKRVPGGTKNAEIAGGNELINLYAQYVNLANDLKARKAALDIAPGIESEAI